MFYLHLSNRTENLLTRLVEILRGQPRRDLFAREYFLIQSQGMERMLSQRLADALPVWCNFEYMLPTRFFDLMASRMDLAINPDAFNRDKLAWRIDALLHQIQLTPDPVFTPILHYLSGERGDLKRYQLALQLANLFDQYQIMRPKMLDGWQKKMISSKNPAEAWQMALWTRLCASLDHSPHRGEMLRLFLERLGDSDNLSAILPAPSLAPATLGRPWPAVAPVPSLAPATLGRPWPARISLFGLHSMPPLLLDCLHAISSHCDVHFYLLSPCQNYWADIPGKRQIIRENLTRLQNNLEPVPPDPDIHPLLVSLGKQGQDFQAMLLERVDNLIDTESFDDPASHSDSPPCLLHRLQSNLLDGSWNGKKEGGTIPLDPSLTLVSCHSPLRETMALKDQILGWLNDNPDMELRDIVVMAPDIQDYAAIIPAVFHDIQHSIADRSLRHQNQALPLFFQFLDLAGSRCSWSSVLDLLEKPEIASNFGDLTESDIELIRHWVTNAGIRFGLSSNQLQTMNLELTEITWQAGLDRLLLGYAMEWEQPVDGVLPYPDIEGSQARPLGGVCQFVELLLKTAKDLRVSRPLTAWSTLLLDYLESLFGSDRENDLVRLREILTDLAPGFGSFHHHDVPLEVIRARLETTASESRTSAGFLRGHLTFCSMLPMRSIPFRAICLLGLNDGVFPKTDRRPPFDLLAENFRPGDRSRRRDDRYQFLEVLLSARQYLYLSHVGQSIRSGRDIPPSVLISELVETLKLSYGIEDPVRKHPLQPFSSNYFSGSGMFSFNGHNCEVAKILSHPTPPAHPAPWWSGSLPEDDTKTINTADLLSFFAHPQKWFVRNRLAIRLDTDMDLPEENELFSVGGLTGYQVNQNIVQTFLETGTGATAEPSPILARLKAQGRWMLGAPGQLAFDRLIPELHDFVSKIQAQNLGLKLPDLPIDLTAADWRVTGQLTGIHENGILLARYTECKGKDLLKAWIHHLLANTLTPTTTKLLSRDRTLSFAPHADPIPELTRLLAVFRQGAVSPSPLHVESAWSYVQQQENERARTSPLQTAIKTLKDSLDNGHEPELALLYGDCDPAALLGPEFQQLCEEFIRPIFLAGRAYS